MVLAGAMWDGPANPPMVALMTVKVDSAEELVRVGELWLGRAFRELAPDAWAQVPERPPGKGRPGAPGGMSAYVTVVSGPMKVKVQDYSARAWEWGLRSLADGAPEVEVELCELNEDGEAYQGPETSNLRAMVKRAQGGGEVLLQVGGSIPGAEGEVWRPEVPQRWARVMRMVADVSEVEYGHISDHGGSEQTPLEMCLRPAVRKNPPGPLLRGYSWVTICPPDAALVLGGATKLAGTGAFYYVEELPSGAVWLQATERFDEYDEVAATRAFSVLTPVLSGGLPDPGMPEQYRFRLAWRDADWYRTGSRAAPLPPLDRASELVAGADPGAGGAREVPGGYEASFERAIGHGRQSIWQALTDPVQIGQWLGQRREGWLPQHPWGLPGPGRMELEPGGTVVLPYCRLGEFGPRIVCNMTTGSVTSVAQQQSLEYVLPGPDGPDATIRWDLEETGDGTVLSLRYLFQAYHRVPLALADWHCRLDAVEALLDGRDPAVVWRDYESRAAAYAS